MEERAIDIIDASIRHVQRSAARGGGCNLAAVRTPEVSRVKCPNP